MKIQKNKLEEIIRKTIQSVINENNVVNVSDVINLDDIPFSQLQCINIDLRDILYGFRFENGITYDGENLNINENVENKTENPKQVKNKLMGFYLLKENIIKNLKKYSKVSNFLF